MKKFWHGYDLFLKGIIGVTSGLFVSLVLVAIFFRYILDNAISWSEEACRILFFITIMFGGAVCVTEARHIVIDLLTMALPRRILRFWYAGIYALMFLFSAFLLVFGFRFAVANMGQVTPSLLIPIGILYLVTPIACTFMCINIVRMAIKDITITYAPKSGLNEQGEKL